MHLKYDDNAIEAQSNDLEDFSAKLWHISMANDLQGQPTDTKSQYHTLKDPSNTSLQLDYLWDRSE